MRKLIEHICRFFFYYLLLIAVIGLLVSVRYTAIQHSKRPIIAPAPELCEIIANEQNVRTPNGSTKIAIVRCKNGELRSFSTEGDNLTGDLFKFPKEAKYAFIVWDRMSKPASIVPVFP